MGIKSRTFDVSGPGAGQKDYAVRLTAEEKKSIEENIKAAKSLDEIARLEKKLRDGMGGGEPMEF